MAAPARTYLEIRGERLSFRQIAEKYGLPLELVRSRYYVWGLEGDELIAPVKVNLRYEVRGERLTLTELAAKYGIQRATLNARAAAGKVGEELIAPPTYIRVDHETRALLNQIHAETGIAMHLLRARYQRGIRDERLREPVLRPGRQPGVSPHRRKVAPEEPSGEEVTGYVEVHPFTNENGEQRFELRLIEEGMVAKVDRTNWGTGYLTTGAAINSASRLFRGYPIK